MPAITRRALLAAPLYAATPIRRETFLKSPGKGTAIMAYAFYPRPTGVDMLSIEQAGP